PDGRPLPRWTAGAHIDVECGSPDRSRQYSLCGDPADTTALEIAVLRERDGRGGSAWIHQQVREGDRLKIRGPRNHFHLDEGAPRALFIAGGIGITPIAAMARRARELGLDYALHYCGRRRSAMALLGGLHGLHDERLLLHVADEGSRADVAALVGRYEPGRQVYACGPVRMLDAVRAATGDWPDDAVRFEHFVS